TWTVINPVVEGTSTVGIWVKQGSNGNTFINGTSEGNLGKGTVLDSSLNTLINTWFEANSGNNIELNRPRNVLMTIPSYSKPTTMSAPNSHMNQVIGGEFSNITITGVNNAIQSAWVANLADTGANTFKFALAIGASGTAQHYSRLGNYLPWLYGLSIVGGAVSTDALTGSVFAITANQNFTLANPTNPTNGQKITWRIMQLNGAQISYGSKFRPPPGGNLPQLALFSGFYYISAMYNLTQDTWDVQ
ncbi:MAG TPA: hypothetical protein VFS12_05265, partial [Terriglobia bacterium]|nr:hypothetical protein [Terriglobia bacterium]